MCVCNSVEFIRELKVMIIQRCQEKCDSDILVLQLQTVNNCIFFIWASVYLSNCIRRYHIIETLTRKARIHIPNMPQPGHSLTCAPSKSAAKRHRTEAALPLQGQLTTEVPPLFPHPFLHNGEGKQVILAEGRRGSKGREVRLAAREKEFVEAV